MARTIGTYGTYQCSKQFSSSSINFLEQLKDYGSVADSGYK